MSLSQLKRKLKNSKVKLTKFCYDLSLALIRSAEVANETITATRLNVGVPSVAAATGGNRGRHIEASEFEFNPNTLKKRLKEETWPIRYKVKVFNRVQAFVELRLTHNNSFCHQTGKIIDNHGKNHCALCYHRQTPYGCNLCKVLLCRTARTKQSSDGRMHHVDSCFNIWHSVRDIEAQRKILMKLGGKRDKEEKRSTRQSADGIITSPFTPKKRKRSTEIKVLTEVRKKSNKRRVSEESDGDTNSESESGDSGSDIPSAAFAKGREENLGDTSDSSVEQPSAPSPKKKTPKTPSNTKDEPSPKKMAAKKTSKAASPANNTRSRGRDQVQQEKSSTLKETTPSTATPRNTRSRSKSGSGSMDKATAKQQSSSGKKHLLPMKKHPPQEARNQPQTLKLLRVQQMKQSG
jgi:hypothetical protein